MRSHANMAKLRQGNSTLKPQTKTLPTLEAAQRHVEMIVSEKLAKGYVECTAV